ncbi:MAG: serine hydrolase domain-containing protein [Thermodesulfobacteriota bacterium]|nr:serine hydrolase domain-containing protein [Thermodesulfobacteriota bacterium]
MKTKGRIRELLRRGVREGVYPGAVLLVAREGKIIFSHKVGNRSLIPESLPMEKHTIFDLASLTKPLGTTLALMKLVDEERIHLDEPLADLLSTALPQNKRALTPRLILSHSAGFVDWQPFYLKLVKYAQEERKRLVRHWIVEAPLAYSPGRGCVYSDLGFMVLEQAIEERAGAVMAQFLESNFYGPLSLENTFLSSESSAMRFKKERFAATEACQWRNEVLQGRVHDENAFALGGYSGHAGLFGTAEEVYRIVNLLRQHYMRKRDDFLRPETVREFFSRQYHVDTCTRALGWDTPSAKNSSSGRYFLPESVGHLGFTGTSVWMELKRDVVVVFLTNRVHPTRTNEKIRTFRPILHDAVMEELKMGSRL